MDQDPEVSSPAQPTGTTSQQRTAGGCLALAGSILLLLFSALLLLSIPSGFDLLGKLIVLVNQPVYGDYPPLPANAATADVPAIISNPDAYVGSNLLLTGRIQNIDQSVNSAYTFLDLRPSEGGTIAVRVYPSNSEFKKDQCLVVYGVVAGADKAMLVDTKEEIVLPTIHAYETRSC